MLFTPQFDGRTTIYYGPPGTGKTFKLLEDLADVLQVARPDEIAYVSFTREGARQGIRRACERFGYTFKDFPYFRTCHSIAFHALGLSKENVMQGWHYRTFGSAIGMNFIGHYNDEITCPDDQYLFLYDLLRNNREYGEKLFLESDINVPIFKFVIQKLKEYKKALNVLDYTDMIARFVSRGTPLPVRYAFIDEAQDLTTLQWQLCTVAFKDAERIFVAGDDDQAIYSWSGADVRAFLALDGEKKVLETSHRLPPPILTLAKAVARSISYRVDKDYHPNKGGGTISYCNDIDDVPLDCEGDYLILVRNRKFMCGVEEYLKSRGLIYSKHNGNSITRSEITAINAWERWRTNGTAMSPAEELRVNKAMDADYKSADKNCAWYDLFSTWDAEQVAYIRMIQARYGELSSLEPTIHVATIHTVKGDEATNVVLLLGMSGLTYKGYLRDPDTEHRVFYVGITRASERLFVVYGKEATSYPLIANA